MLRIHMHVVIITIDVLNDDIISFVCDASRVENSIDITFIKNIMEVGFLIFVLFNQN